MYCGKDNYKEKQEVHECIDKHGIILLPISLEDLNRLYQYMHLGQEELLTRSLVNVVTRYKIANNRR